MTDRRRNALILLIVAGLVVASAAAIAVKKTRLGLDLKGGVELTYQGKPTAQSKVNAESLNRAIDIMRTRVDQLGPGSAGNPAHWGQRNQRGAARCEQHRARGR